MTDYENMSLEELKKLKEEREKAELLKQLSVEDEAKAKAEQESYEAKVKAAAIEEYKNSLKDESTPEVKLVTSNVSTSKDADMNKYLKWLKDYTGGKIRGYEGIESKGKKTFDYWGTSADDPRNDNCPTDVDDWSPEGVWVAAIWHDFYEYANLLQVCVPGLNIDKGQGFTAIIRTISPFSVDSITEDMDSCDCLSCTNTSMSKVTIGIKQHGFSTVICGQDLWDVGDALRTATLKEFSLVWSKFFDENVYDALDNATGNTSHNQEISSCTDDCSSPSGECCEDEFMMDLYYAFDKAITGMRSDYYNPDYIIIHPEVARIFRGMQTPQPVFYNNALKWGDNGKLLSIFGVKVIEYNGANEIGSGDNIAIILDSRRAVGAPFGERPKMLSEYNKECDAYEYYMRCYWGVKVLTDNAIALISCS
jgi:hypothetical protein